MICYILRDACHDNDGYIQVNKNGKTEMFHRILYERSRNESIPEGYSVTTICGNKDCINPEHLVLRLSYEKPRKRDKNTKCLYITKSDIFIISYIIDIDKKVSKIDISNKLSFPIELIDTILNFKILELINMTNKEIVDSLIRIDNLEIVKDEQICFSFFEYEYPNIYINNMVKRASRYIVEQREKNNFDKNFVAMHICNNPKCLRSKHIKMGTQAENMEHKMKSDRQFKNREIDKYNSLIFYMSEYMKKSNRYIAKYISEKLGKNIDHKTIKNRYDKYKEKIIINSAGNPPTH